MSTYVCILAFYIKICFQEEDPNRNKKKPLGDTNHFCPVALKDNFVLYPGNPEIASKYREKVYYFSTNEARDKFIVNPTEFLPKHKPLDVSTGQANSRNKLLEDSRMIAFTTCICVIDFYQILHFPPYIIFSIFFIKCIIFAAPTNSCVDSGSPRSW
jgi:YHS domain-containing protein